MKEGSLLVISTGSFPHLGTPAKCSLCCYLRTASTNLPPHPHPLPALTLPFLCPGQVCCGERVIFPTLQMLL